MIELFIVPPTDETIPVGAAQMIAESTHRDDEPFAIAVARSPRTGWLRVLPRFLYDGEWIVTMWCPNNRMGIPVNKIGRGRTRRHATRRLMRELRPARNGNQTKLRTDQGPP